MKTVKKIMMEKLKEFVLKGFPLWDVDSQFNKMLPGAFAVKPGKSYQ